MGKKEYPCPCGGIVQWKKDTVIIDGVNCGLLDVEYCPKCGEEYFPEETMHIVEEQLKKEGLWGIQRKEVHLWKSGNSVLVRIPKEIAQALHLKPDERVKIYAEGKKRMIIDL